ncbi:MAG: aminoacyl-tRNA hydrolase [Spirochaetia bacterium]|nr:aminoacyl-tRNA hydrolase [Spirochaetia bacterium]MCF7940807.1 aminoacyl-tRNA hydrolase [Spirochaetia bacterium]
MIGLGNPGKTYEKTRHNAGFLAIDSLSETLDIPIRKRLFHPYMYGICRGSDDMTHYIVKPLTFMNSSGRVLESLFSRSGQSASDIILLCDNMDLPPGDLRIRKQGSAAGHNGIRSIMDHAGTGEFLRIYIGVGRPAPGVSVIDHVLGIPSADDMALIDQAAAHAAACVERLLHGEKLTKVINEYTRTFSRTTCS